MLDEQWGLARYYARFRAEWLVTSADLVPVGEVGKSRSRPTLAGRHSRIHPMTNAESVTATTFTRRHIQICLERRSRVEHAFPDKEDPLQPTVELPIRTPLFWHRGADAVHVIDNAGLVRAKQMVEALAKSDETVRQFLADSASQSKH